MAITISFGKISMTKGKSLFLDEQKILTAKLFHYFAKFIQKAIE